jgi:hypothetical protein
MSILNKTRLMYCLMFLLLFCGIASCSNGKIDPNVLDTIKEMYGKNRDHNIQKLQLQQQQRTQPQGTICCAQNNVNCRLSNAVPKGTSCSCRRRIYNRTYEYRGQVCK